MNKQQQLRTFASVIVVVAAIGLIYYFRADTPLRQGGAGVTDATNTVSGTSQPVPQIATEKKTGREFISNELIVEFTPSLSEADALAIIASVGGEMIARTTAIPVFRVRIKTDEGDGEETIKAVTKLENNVKVIHAELNYLTILESQPPAPKTP